MDADAKFDRIEKSIGDLTEIVVAMKGYMETNLVTKQELEETLTIRLHELREELVAKIEGVQRSVGAPQV